MFRNRYGNFLTVLLVIAILVIIGFIVFLGVQSYKKYKLSRDSIQAISEFENYINTQTNEISQDRNTIDITNEIISNTNQTTVKTKKYYKDFIMLGYIEIKKTNVKYPILEKETTKSLETSVAVRYPTTNIRLNQPGNIVIVGHNYRNGTFFSNNKKLSTGDKIYITDDTGNTLAYIIYQIFSTTPEDASFYNRDTNGAIEITLSTCSDDGNTRLIIQARADNN